MDKNIPQIPSKARRDLCREDLCRRVSTDMLSGLLNRDTMERCIKERLADMKPEETCALFIVDIDNFKMVNDKLGHPAGDEVIRQIAHILSGLFRASDIVGRLGGDEFAIFLCGRITKKVVLEKASSICEKLQLTLGRSETVNITVSVGIYLADRGETFEGLYQSADLALYKAKKAGKHQFFLKNRNQGPLRIGELQPASVITLGVLLEHMESGVALLEMSEVPQVIYVSPSFCRIIGTDPSGIRLPKPLREWIHPDDLAPLLSVLQESAVHDQIVESTHRIRAGEGRSWLWWQVRAVRIEDRGSHPVLLVTATDVSRLKETQRGQEEQIRRLQTAFNMTAWHIWEVDLAARTFQMDAHKAHGEPLEQGPFRFPEDLIGNGWVHPDSVPRFRLFAHDLLNGNARGFGNFAIRRQDSDCYGWFSFSYQMLFDDVGRAVRAVGVVEDLPAHFTGQDSQTAETFRLPENLISDLVVQMCADLTSDRVESLWIEGTVFDDKVRDTPCSEILNLEKQHIFCKGEQKDFRSNFDREALLRRYAAGQRWLCAEYRRADRSGSIRPIRHILYLTEEPVSRHVRLFVYMIALDPDRLFAHVVRSETERDPVSRLYSRDAVQRMAETLFSDRRSGNRAVAVLQINGMEKLPAGPEKDRLLYGIAAGLSLVLGGSCLLGQHAPHQIVVVFPDITEKDGLRRRLEESAAVLRRMLALEPACRKLRFLTGVCMMPAAAANYRSMLGQAIDACARCWNAAADTVAFAQEPEEPDWSRLYADESEILSASAGAAARPLSEQEKELALDGVSAMLAAKTLDASLSGVLRTIGDYYHADRVYTLMLTESRNAVTMTFEWTNGAKHSIQRVVSGMPVEKFPLLLQCMREKAPAFLSRPRPAGTDGAGKAGSTWHFTVFPLMREPRQTVAGFLCIENARKHPTDIAVFGTLIPFMLQQRERFSLRAHASDAADPLMDVPGLRSYVDTLHTIHSDYYSSMGAVCLDIPGFAVSGASQSTEAKNQMLRYVIRALAELFGRTLLFRTREAEFIAFYPNSTREEFLGRCGRLWTILRRRYPRQTRIGQSWAHGVFTGEHLAEDATAAMRSAPTESLAQGLSVLPDILYAPAAGDTMHNGQFTVYFQPKVDMRNGALAGAEALIRRIAEDGSIVSPAQFIPLMEETGAIRELDLFVLEQSLAQVEQWRAAGLGIVPVAVNLSRTTLAHPATLAAVLAIQSHYPDIPESALELEITERGDRLGTSELQYYVERFHSCGLRIGLDDFGSQYANLSLFTNVPFETVKLDKSLIDNLASNRISRMLVRDLVEICHDCHMTCVAEGVETQEQIDALLEMGSVYAQGFYYDRPLSADAFAQKYLHGCAAVRTGQV